MMQPIGKTTHPRLSKKSGLPPGTLMYIGKKATDKPLLHWMAYSPDGVKEAKPETTGEMLQLTRDKGSILWLDIVGINHIDCIEEVGRHFKLHALVLEDIVNTEQRPKFEEFPGYTFFSLKQAEFRSKPQLISFSQVSIIFGEDFIITFREDDDGLFENLRVRLHSDASRARTRRPDFLVYLIIDRIVDMYFDIIEKTSDDIESIEEKMFQSADKGSVRLFQQMKRNLFILLKSLYPLREAIIKLEKHDSPFLVAETIPYIRDVYDHTLHIIESIESERDILTGVMDVYLTSQNTRMNSVMKVLTVIATIFIPLSFLASVYGMNFKYMPELLWRYGYLYFWIFMLLIIGGMLLYFKNKKWL